MSLEARGTSPNATAWAGIRTIIVPPDIVAVQRRSPLRVRTRTPWQPRRDGEALTERAGSRDWFSDRLFVEAQDGHGRSGYGTSIAVHVSCAIVLIVVLLSRPPQTLRVNGGSSLVMPAMLSIVPIADAPIPASRPIERSAPKAAPEPPAALPPPAAGFSAPAPIEAPSGITPETGFESGAEGAEGGVAGGVPGGVIGGALSVGAPSAGPLRLGGGIKQPRKIKEVTPVYPQGALADQARGTVIIEATIGVDGRVQETKVIHSVPSLDQAAVDAVRQWEYAPSLLNGVPVAVILTVIVNFAIQ